MFVCFGNQNQILRFTLVWPLQTEHLHVFFGLEMRFYAHVSQEIHKEAVASAKSDAWNRAGSRGFFSSGRFLFGVGPSGVAVFLGFYMSL